MPSLNFVRIPNWLFLMTLFIALTVVFESVVLIFDDFAVIFDNFIIQILCSDHL